MSKIAKGEKLFCQSLKINWVGMEGEFLPENSPLCRGDADLEAGSVQSRRNQKKVGNQCDNYWTL